MLKPQGIIPAMITPFTNEQELDEQGIRKLVRTLADAGVHGLFCLGTNGEFFSLSYEEKTAVAEIAADELQGRIPLYVGVGHASTRETVRLARKAEEIGANALSVITPYFLPLTQQELYAHYRTVAESTPLPVLLYNIPARTGNALHPDTVAKLAEIPNIVGIKDSSGSIETIQQYLEAAPPEFAVMAGSDWMILPALLAGGRGAVASSANVLPQTVVGIYEGWLRGDIASAERCQRQLRALLAAFRRHTLPSVLKEALNQIGLPAGPARDPVSPADAGLKLELEQMIAKYHEQGLLPLRSSI